MGNSNQFSAWKRYLRTYATDPVAGETRHRERAFLHWLAAHEYTGQGEIVDLGSRFGATVTAMARGLSESALPMRKKAKRIHAFGCFDCAFCPDDGHRLWEGRPADGLGRRESSLADYLDATAAWKELVETHAGDLHKAAWSGQPIEFLHVGCMDSWEMVNFVTRQFYSRLLPGGSYVVHRNFGSGDYPFIHLHVYHLRSYIEPVFHIPHTGSLVLKAVRRIPEQMVRAPIHPSHFSDEDLEKAYDFCRGLVGTEKISCVAAGKAMFELSQGNAAAAAETLRRIEAEGLTPDPRCDCLDAAWKAVYSRGYVGYCASPGSGVYFGA